MYSKPCLLLVQMPQFGLTVMDWVSCEEWLVLISTVVTVVQIQTGNQWSLPKSGSPNFQSLYSAAPRRLTDLSVYYNTLIQHCLEHSRSAVYTHFSAALLYVVFRAVRILHTFTCIRHSQCRLFIWRTGR